MTGRVTLPAGHALNTRIDGPEGAPWLMLSNSLGANLTMWDPQMAALTRRYRVLRYDTRGHGESDSPEGPYHFDDLLSDVVGLLDHFGVARTAFMGLSMGGMTGLGLALHHPDRIERVVCADARADAPPPFREMWDQRIAKVEAEGLKGIVEGTLGGWLTEAWREANPAAVEAVRTMVLGNDPAGYIGCCRALRGLDYLRHLGAVTLPILYVGGEVDMGALPAVMQEMAEATPGGAYRMIPAAAHVANINAPEAFTAAIADFLSLDV